MLEQGPFQVYQNPSVDRALEALKLAISRRRNLIVVGDCWVQYQGRASSKLEPGERILILKEDGSVLIHKSTGYEPVNWQPPGCIFQSYLDNDAIVIKAVRQKPREIITIFFDRIHLLSAFNLVDRGEFTLHASEEEMQKAILLNPSIIEEGLKPITFEKKVEPGFIDVYGIDKDGRMVVVEIKRKIAGREAVLQLSRYVDSLKPSSNREIRGILTAPQIAKGTQKLLISLGLEFKVLDPKKCTNILRRAENKKLAAYF